MITRRAIRNAAVSGVAVLALGTYASPASAWNIICGISVLSFGAADMDRKWEADSAALQGIGEFYMALSDMQSINVEFALQDEPSASRDIEISKIDGALERLMESRNSFERAISEAEGMITASNPLDSIGEKSISLWREMVDLNSEFISAMEEGYLPDLYRLHEAIDTIHEIGNLGMRASLMHLNQHETQHSSGGPSARFR